MEYKFIKIIEEMYNATAHPKTAVLVRIRNGRTEIHWSDRIQAEPILVIEGHDVLIETEIHKLTQSLPLVLSIWRIHREQQP